MHKQATPPDVVWRQFAPIEKVYECSKTLGPCMGLFADWLTMRRSTAAKCCNLHRPSCHSTVSVTTLKESGSGW